VTAQALVYILTVLSRSQGVSFTRKQFYLINRLLYQVTINDDLSWNKAIYMFRYAV